MNVFIKNIRIPALLILLTFIAPSCDNFLEEKPKDRISVANSYITEQDAFSAVIRSVAFITALFG
jgi:hypothetical protein